MVDAPAWLSRLTTWLERFEPVFAHAQRGGLRRYVEGVLCDSRRKSMAAMWARLRDPGTYQGLQYFITEATWNADALWRQLRATIPARSGVLVLDGTGFPSRDRVGRRAAPVLGHAGQDRQLPSGRHGGAVDGRAGLAGRRAAVCRRGGSRRRSGLVAGFRRASASRRSGARR